jgi:hypothetical protein
MMGQFHCHRRQVGVGDLALCKPFRQKRWSLHQAIHRGRRLKVVQEVAHVESEVLKRSRPLSHFRE